MTGSNIEHLLWLAWCGNERCDKCSDHSEKRRHRARELHPHRVVGTDRARRYRPALTHRPGDVAIAVDDPLMGEEVGDRTDVRRQTFIEEDGCGRRTRVAAAFFPEESANRQIVTENSHGAL